MSPEEVLANQRKTITLAIEKIQKANEGGRFLSFIALGVEQDGTIHNEFHLLSNQQILVGGVLSKLSFMTWRAVEGMEVAMSQQQAHAELTAAASARGRPDPCPKEKLIGGCDYPECDCTETIRPS